MPNTKDDENLIKMFGCTSQEIDELISQSCNEIEDGRFMLAASILSDSQEVMSNNPDMSRQFINKAKYIIFKLKEQYVPR